MNSRECSIWRRGATIFRLCIGMVMTFSVDAVTASEYDWCALGETLAPGREFIQSRRVQVHVQGPPVGEYSAAFSEELIRRRLWPDQAESVFVSPYVAGQCGPVDRKGGVVTVSVTAAEVAALKEEMDKRGNGVDLPTIATVSNRATVVLAPNSSPSESMIGIHWVRVFYVTNRQQRSAKSASAFGADDAEKLSFGSVDVSIPAGHRLGTVESPSVLRVLWTMNPEKYISLAPSVTPLSSAEWASEVRERASALNRPGVLLFVHGYNVTFPDGARRAAQLANDIAFEGPTVFFSWPSDGELLPYLRDDNRASNAKYLMADLLQTLTKLQKGLPIFVVAHSMGNRVMLQGLVDLFQKDPLAHQSFRQIILASPDVGQIEFKQLFEHSLAGTNPRYTLYASDRDVPIDISSWLRDEPRLGSGGVNTFVHVGVDSIDASAITRSFFGIEHSYFADHTTLLSDIFTLIHTGRDPDHRFGLTTVDTRRGRYWAFIP